MEFTESLKALKRQIEERMSAYIEIQKKAVQENDLFLESALRDAEEVILGGGKRIRGALLYQGYKAAGGTDTEAALQAAAGMEFIHSYLLIHDDIMDRDSLRHGVETLHTRYHRFANTHFPKKDGEHFGAAIAITLGDMVCAWGNDCIFSVDLPREHIKNAIRKVQEVVHRTGVGQMRDMYIEFSGNATEEEILEMYKDKTAYYSLEGPLQIGLLLGGGNEELKKVFHEFALPLGIAFQLQDDLLGLFGEQEQLGKRVGSDVAEGKFTLLIQKTLSQSTQEEKNTLNRILSLGEAVTESDIEWVRQRVIESGAKEEIEKRIESYIQEALNILHQSTLPEEVAEFLEGMAEYMKTRSH